jgi:hypothetical protein
MAKTDANPPMPDWSTEYQLVEVDADYCRRQSNLNNSFTSINLNASCAKDVSTSALGNASTWSTPVLLQKRKVPKSQDSTPLTM